MNVQIQTIHFDADKKLLTFVEEKVKKLNQIYDGVVSSEVSLKIDKSDTNDNKIAEIRLLISGNDLFAKKQCKSFEEATDSAVEALRKQLVKYKEKVKDI